eukprot:COSAG01_NODE_2256_length_8067_cov_5.797691_4_plen_78_part_00
MQNKYYSRLPFAVVDALRVPPGTQIFECKQASKCQTAVARRLEISIIMNQLSIERTLCSIQSRTCSELLPWHRGGTG